MKDGSVSDHKQKNLLSRLRPDSIKNRYHQNSEGEFVDICSIHRKDTERPCTQAWDVLYIQIRYICA